MKKAERRKAQLEAHYANLEAVAKLNGVENPNGKRISSRLLALEGKATRATTAYCNAEMKDEEVDAELLEVQNGVINLFNGLPFCFHINRDPRGYALKLDDHAMRTFYKEVNLHRDMAGYGILAPLIDGD